MHLQGPAQAQNLRDSLVEAKSDIVVKVKSPTDFCWLHTFVLLDLSLFCYVTLKAVP